MKFLCRVVRYCFVGGILANVFVLLSCVLLRFIAVMRDVRVAELNASEVLCYIMRPQVCCVQSSLHSFCGNSHNLLSFFAVFIDLACKNDSLISVKIA